MCLAENKPLVAFVDTIGQETPMKLTFESGEVVNVNEFTISLEDGGEFTITQSNDQLRVINESFGFLRITVHSKNVIAIKSEY